MEEFFIITQESCQVITPVYYYCRNYISHAYDSIIDEILWGIIVKHLPQLEKEVAALLQPAS